jgi:hypothetical protein
MNKAQKWIIAGFISFLILTLIGAILIPPPKWDRILIRTSGEFTICELSSGGHSKSIWVYHSDKCDPDFAVGKLKK